MADLIPGYAALADEGERLRARTEALVGAQRATGTIVLAERT